MSTSVPLDVRYVFIHPTVNGFVNDPNAKTEQSHHPGEVEQPIDATRHWSEDGDETFVIPFEDFSNRVLGEFRLLRLLGRGGMADVYLADQTSLNRKVAIKILRPELKANGVFLKRFEREARAAASLSHPNIVQVFLVGEDDGLHFIAQEYVKGLNLREFIRRKGPPNAQLALHFIKQVLLALDRAGDEGIVHRDIKPENILITQKGTIKVADFGLAQLVRQETDKSALELTQVGTTIGTPLYMSPEQVHGSKLDQRSDLYSLGVTCFHMLAGEPPFHGESAMSVAIQHLNEKPPRLRDRRPDLPPALCQFVHKLMAKDPERRYPDAASALKDVKQIQTALKQDVDPQSLSLSGFDLDWDQEEVAPSTWIQSIASWSRTRKIAAYAAICLLIAGTSASLGWWAKPADPMKQPAPTQPKIPTRATAAEQYKLAMQSFPDEVEAWNAVIHHEDNDKTYRYMAQEQLGLFYLRTLKLDQAAEIFDAMSQLEGGALEAEYRTKALAGQAVIANLRGENARAEALYEQFLAQPELNDDGPLQTYLDELVQRVNQNQSSNSD